MTANTQQQKPLVAIDVDEVLAQFLAPCNQFYNNTYHTNFDEQDYHSYAFCETWKCSDSEAIERVYQFMASEAMKDLPLVPGALEGVSRLSRNFRLVVVTSRQSFLKGLTMEWLERHFGKETFEAVLFGNQWLRSGDTSASFSKSELCASVGAVALIDDLPKYILEVTQTKTCELGILFNRDLKQKWSTIPPPLPDRCRVATSWPHVCELLEASIAPPPSPPQQQDPIPPQQESTLVQS